MTELASKERTAGSVVTQRSSDDCALIDVRTRGEFQESHIPGSINVPLADLARFEDELSAKAKDQELVLVCRTGRRAEEALTQLKKLEGARLSILQGGIESWVAEGHEVKRGKKTISLERQVRIAAGSLAVLGAVLGFLVHPAFHFLSGFVGAGLVFAGLTDTCGMAILLGRLPCNRVTCLTPAK